MARKFSLEPAASVIRVLGGAAVVGGIVGIGRTQVWKWTQPKSRGGTGGLVPSEHQSPLLRWAIENNKPLTPAMFFILDTREVPRSVSV